MTYQISVTQTGVPGAVEAMFGRVQRLIEDPIALAKEELIKWFQENQRQQFAREGATGQTGRWPRLSERYAARKAREFPGAKILERTQRLLLSLTSRTADSLIAISSNRLELGSTVPYAGYHQKGEGQKRRPPIDITDRNAAEIAAIVRRRMFAEIKRAAGVAV